ncbi:hypothetical protein SJI45_06080 [Streptomyces sp. S399]|uniref:hypothetical protein n=1 Tax=Streptomyces sp. S399 TaxID=3096009 RepID=UPI002A8215A1|nr:hypothetical protein [Streptomyces sp. S399]WPR54885.1 hypothetical protein SJI45_06080 [Streptomyces sp. S399]
MAAGAGVGGDRAGGPGLDTTEVREALAARLADEDPATVAEAAAGLVRRGAAPGRRRRWPCS